MVSVFCGGRGGSNLIREFLRRPDLELNALINAYDDGLSTGEIAEATSVSENVVSVRIHRGIAKLRGRIRKLIPA